MILSEAKSNPKYEIKNILFDWGGVITDLHLEATKKAFQDLGLPFLMNVYRIIRSTLYLFLLKLETYPRKNSETISGRLSTWHTYRFDD